MKKGLFITLLYWLSSTALQAQADTALRDSLVRYASKHRNNIMEAIVVNGDTIPLMVLDEVLLVDKPTFSSRMARHRYNILKRKVIKVYPYAVEAGNKLDSLRLVLEEDDGGWFDFDRNRQIKEFQEYLRTKYEPVVRQLTHSEGQILSKLIHRETGMTSYDLIQKYRSGFNAFWWNVVANINKISLKTPYRPAENEEDKLIETILKVAFAEKRLQEREPITSLDQLAPQDSTETPVDSAAVK